MIIVRLCGGLGNQLFQYAAGRRLSLERQAELVLDLSWYKYTPKSNTLRQYELINYPIQARAAGRNEEILCRLYSSRILKYISIPSWPWSRYHETGFEFNPAFADIKDNTYIDGYWQSYKYFEDVAEIIRKELIPLPIPSALDQSIANQIFATESVSVHVRRGDYVTQKAAANTHGVCQLEYYYAALDTIKQIVPNPHFYVFSDDPDWCKSNLTFPGSAVFVDHNSDTTAFQDMQLMSRCRHHIIANSSFSWWGAWLNPRKDKRVIAPKRWFMDDRSTVSLTPAEWIRL
jgi:hypothetical protein